MKKISFALALLVLLLGQQLSAQSSLAITNISYDDSSYMKVADAIKNFKLVGLGESVHGIVEFHKWNFSFAKFLFQQKMANVLVIEDSYSHVKKINDYIQGKTSSRHIDSLLQVSLYNIWQSDDLLSLIEYMRLYNSQNHHNKLSIIGADMQDADCVYDLYSFLGNKIPYLKDISHKKIELISNLGKGEKYSFKKLADADKEDIRKTINLFQNCLDSLSHAQGSDTSSNDFIIARQDLTVLKQCYENETIGIFKWLKYRNQMLAKNVLWADRYFSNGRKTIFISHNGHIAIRALSTGKYLNNSGIKYYPLLQDFITGNIKNNYSGQGSYIDSKDEHNMLPSLFENRKGDMFFINFNQPEVSKNIDGKYIHDAGASNGFLKIKINITCKGIIIHKKVNSSL